MANTKRRIVRAAGAPTPTGQYNQAVIVDKTMYISGFVGFDPATTTLVPGGVREQTEQTLKNIGEVLKAAGATYNNVVKTTVLLTDMNDYAVVNEVYGKYFSENKPARAAYQIGCLPAREAKVEIEAVAVLGNIVDGKL
ncbi:2-iminobutanoate/2-iminopropanoate deaminase-like isoform X2 [Littorina saxatilis]|uniref:2-iminobutanoate/2-iminopropanoate deaminase n=1 Tax=Littorina saxatilis TaxID=31220 RepID=A0AAN9GAZ0_9CAEN